jgi:uncharacterized protein involved in outer membrane biogenesis
MRHRWIAAAAVAAIAASLAAAEAAQWPGIGRVIAWSAERSTGWAVQHERCRARLLTAAWLACDRIALTDATSQPAPSLSINAVGNAWFDGTQVRVAWDWGELWRWRRGAALHLRDLSAQTLRLRLERDANGAATWQPPQPGAEPASNAAAPMPRVDVLTVATGDIAWSDALTATRLAITLRAAGDGGSPPATDSGMRATIDGRWRQLPMSLRASTNALLPLLQSQAGAAKLPLSVQGTVGAATIGFDGSAAALFGERELDGAVTLSGPSLARAGAPLGLTLPETPPFELKGRLAHGEGVWRLDESQARIGRSRLGGDFVFDPRDQPPLLTGRLVAPRLLLADLGPSIGAPVPAANPATASAGARSARSRAGPRSDALGASAAAEPARDRVRVLPDRKFDLPSLRAMQARLDVDIDTLDLGTPGVRALRQLRTQLTLQDGSLRLTRLNAVVAGGRLQGDTRLDERNGTARWSAQLRFEGVDVAAWLPVLGADGDPAARTSSPARHARSAGTTTRNAGTTRTTRRATPDAGAYVTGKLVAQADVRGSGRSTAQILSTLEGQADATIRNGTVSHLLTEALGLDLAQALGVMVRGDRALALRCARVHLELRDGVATVGPAVFDNSDSTLRAAGTISLAEETLALAVRSRPKDISFLSLRAPVTVTGRWLDPVVGIEGRSLAGRVLGAAVLAAIVAPAAALLPLFDPGEKQAGDPCAAP